VQERFDYTSGGGTQTLRGHLSKVWFRNAETGFLAGQFTLDEGGRKISVRGPISELQEGQPVALIGHFEVHPRFGEQFAVESIEIERPEGREAVLAYLSSGLIDGVGPALAERIVQELGDDALERIDEDPSCLQGVPGIGPKKAAAIAEALAAQSSLQDVLLFLTSHGLSPALTNRILEAYGRDAARQLKNNPYRLADEVVGIGFKRADEIAHRIGIEPNSIERKCAGLLYALQDAVQRGGHCCLPRSTWLQRGSELLGLPTESLEPALEDLAEQRRVVVEKLPGLPVMTETEEEQCYPLRLHLAELGLAQAIEQLAGVQGARLGVSPSGAVENWQRRSGFELAPAQVQALQTALRRCFCVITGGPGVGKTTIVRALTETMREAGKRIALAAPTGRAAKRMTEATGHEASTIHRLLEFQAGTGRFARDERNPLEVDILVIDESSMLDLVLARHLLVAISPGTHLVLVGDVDQLPSVGPGRVLEDLIRSGRVPVVRLSRIYRQATGSEIVEAAHRILEGRLPELSNDDPSADFFFIAQDKPPNQPRPDPPRRRGAAARALRPRPDPRHPSDLPDVSRRARCRQHQPHAERNPRPGRRRPHTRQPAVSRRRQDPADPQ
jgi:exodeoxyribonuclease V alpha subunit